MIAYWGSLDAIQKLLLISSVGMVLAYIVLGLIAPKRRKPSLTSAPDSGDDLLGVECYVWDGPTYSRKSAIVGNVFSVIDFGARGIKYAVDGTGWYQHARPVSLGEPS